MAALRCDSNTLPWQKALDMYMIETAHSAPPLLICFAICCDGTVPLQECRLAHTFFTMMWRIELQSFACGDQSHIPANTRNVFDSSPKMNPCLANAQKAQ